MASDVETKLGNSKLNHLRTLMSDLAVTRTVAGSQKVITQLGRKGFWWDEDHQNFFRGLVVASQFSYPTKKVHCLVISTWYVT
jgi:hypothetical protein